MIDAVLVPEKTKVTAKGEGATVEITGAETRVFLANLKITDIVEQEALDLTIVGSVDGNTWNPKPLAEFPQQFYRGETPLLVDLSDLPDVKFVRAHWEVNRWGRGSETPMFEFGATLKEVPAQMLNEARAEAKSRA